MGGGESQACCEGAVRGGGQVDAWEKEGVYGT